MSQADAYLFFPGTCAEAMRFYEKTLGGKIEMMMTHDQMPLPPGTPKPPPGNAHLVMHARLALEGRSLMASDWMGGEQPYPGMHGFSLSLVYPTVDAANRIFATLAEGGKVNMPMQKTFWVEIFGMLVDRYGTPWMINGGQSTV